MREYGSEFDWDSKDACLCRERTAWFSEMDLFRSGRDALRAVAQQQRPRRHHVWMPTLCCQSMVDPFLQAGYSVGFYPIDGNLRAEAAFLAEQLHADDLLLNLNYFGHPLLTTEEIADLRATHPTVYALFDNTHGLLTPPEDRAVYDGVVVSVRKWFALPDGGVLWQRVPGRLPASQDAEFASLRKRAMIGKSRYLQSGDPAEKQAFRDLLGRAVARIDTAEDTACMDGESADILFHTDCRRVLQRRAENCAILAENLREQTLLSPLRGEFETGAQLYLPVLTKKRDLVQNALARRGVFCPVIWPLPKEAAGLAGMAERRIADEMLALPCDQRYGTADMERIAAAVKSVEREVSL